MSPQHYDMEMGAGTFHPATPDRWTLWRKPKPHTALGIDPLVNDIHFVEDNWESPTLGAWGLGWEVWQNGMEVTQFNLIS